MTHKDAHLGASQASQLMGLALHWARAQLNTQQKDTFRPLYNFSFYSTVLFGDLLWGPGSSVCILRPFIDLPTE